jgi:hypothetical protein
LYNRQCRIGRAHTGLALAEWQLLVLVSSSFLRAVVDADAAWLAAIRAGDGAFIMALDCGTAAAFG